MCIRHCFRAYLAFVCALAAASCASSGPSGPSFAVWFDSTVEPDAPIRVDVYLVDDCELVSMGAQEVASVASTSVVKGGPGGAFRDALPQGEYGLYGVAQDDTCAVVAAGCAPVSVTSTQETLSLILSRVDGSACPVELCDNQTGACGTGGAGGMSIDRVTDGLIVLYEFDEGSGSTVNDRSGVDPALDLTIDDPANVSWSGDHLTIDNGTALRTSSEATKVFSRVVQNNQLTVEAWVKPSSLIAVGVPPDRIVTMSSSTSQRNFLLGQDAETYAARFRTPSERNGNPTIYTTPASATTSLTHLVFTHDSNGTEVLYVNGAVDTTYSRAGDTSTWDPSFPLIVANEATRDREWLGELHLIAIYDRALSPEEVEHNFTVGP
jgi:hypothetical protein